MRKLILVVFVFIGVLVAYNTRDVNAAGCTYNSQCNGNPCACPGGTAWCDSGGTCQYTCNNSCTATIPGNVCNCTAYGGWSECSGGYRTRDCRSYSGNCPPPDIYQIDYCAEPTGPGGPGNTNTPAPSCTTGSWTNGACGGGGCPSGSRQQTRTVSPAGCDTTSQCVADASCSITPTTPVGCTPGPWVNGACGGGSCSANQREQTRTTNPPGCVAVTQCIADPACVPPPTAAVCTVSSAVLSPSSTSVNVGSGVNFTLTVNDSPAGCVGDANFVRSNTNASITSGNPDLNEPFVATVYCNSVGSTSITGQARVGGVSRASDTSTINCTALPTAPVTATPAPGQCNGPSLSGSGSCSGSTLNMNFSWNMVTSATLYRRQLSTSPTFSTILSDTTGTGATFSSSQPGGSYYARVRVESANSCAAPSNWSNRVTISNNCGSFVTPPPTPTAVPPTPTPTPPPAQITAQPVVLNGTGSSGQAWITFVTGSPAPAPSPANFVISGVVGVATISTPDSNGGPWTATVTAIGIGTTNYTVVGTDSNGNLVSATGEVTVLNPQPWCQAKEGEMIAGGVSSAGNINCPIPNSCSLNPGCEPSLIIADTGEDVGVVVAGGTVDDNAGLSDPAVSPNMTIEGSDYGGTTYNYSYFLNKVGSPNLTGVSSITTASLLGTPTDSKGYHWVRMNTCPANINSNIDVGTNKVVLFVPCHIQINGSINLTDGRGFFMIIVNGNIDISGDIGGAADTTPDLEGLYFASGRFNTQDPDVDPDQQLHVRGVVYAGSFGLDRDLEDNSAIPSEFFEFGADQMMMLPTVLSRKQVIWKEVAP